MAAEPAERDRSIGRKTPSKRVLMIASRFPPVASVGATRARKFAKYLGHYGWDPTIITGAARRGSSSSQDARRATDPDSLRELPPDLPIHRLSPVPDNLPGFVSRACATMLARMTSRIGFDGYNWAGLLRWRLQKWQDGLSFPDRGIWRLPSAVRLAVRLHRERPFDAVFSSGMPFSDHLIGLVLHVLLRRPWIVDFRDPWVEYIHWQQWHSTWGRRLTQFAESTVIGHAAYVVSVNDYMTRRFVARYGDATKDRFITIANGFDPEDFRSPKRAAPDGRFRLLYAGSLYRTRSPERVLEAFRRFAQEIPGARSRVQFDFAGRQGPYADLLSGNGDGVCIRHLGMLSHSQALQAMAGADVNVILLPNLPGSENDTTAKLYECLGSGAAILAAVPADGAAAAVLRGHDGVWLCDPDDVPGMVKVLVEQYRRWLAGTLAPHRPPQKLSSLTRQTQARQLAACLDAATSRCRCVAGAG